MFFGVEEGEGEVEAGFMLDFGRVFHENTTKTGLGWGLGWLGLVRVGVWVIRGGIDGIFGYLGNTFGEKKLIEKFSHSEIL